MSKKHTFTLNALITDQTDIVLYNTLNQMLLRRTKR